MIALLIVIAHPDDEFPMVGLIKEARDKNVPVYILCMTKGEAGRVLDDKISWLESMTIEEIRQEEFEKSMEILNVTSSIQYNQKDSGSNEWDESFISQEIRDCIKQNNITHVITYDENGINGHPDHKAVSKITLETCKSLDVGIIVSTLFPRSFLSKKLWFLPSKKKDRLLNKVTHDDNDSLKVFKAKNNNRFDYIDVYNSQFPDIRGKYYGQLKIMWRVFGKYEAYQEVSEGALKEILRIGKWV